MFSDRCTSGMLSHPLGASCSSMPVSTTRMPCPNNSTRSKPFTTSKYKLLKNGTNCLGQLFHSFQPWSKQALKTLQGDLVRKRTYKNTHPALHRHLNFTNTLLYQHLHIIIYVYIIYVACSLQWGEQTFNVQALPHMRAPHRDNRVLKRRK